VEISKLSAVCVEIIQYKRINCMFAATLDYLFS